MKSQVEIVNEGRGRDNGVAMRYGDDSVWLTFCRPWWDIASWFWWWLSPGRKIWVQLNRGDTKVRVRAVKLGTKLVRVSAPPKKEE